MCECVCVCACVLGHFILMRAQLRDLIFFSFVRPTLLHSQFVTMDVLTLPVQCTFARLSLQRIKNAITRIHDHMTRQKERKINGLFIQRRKA